MKTGSNQLNCMLFVKLVHMKNIFFCCVLALFVSVSAQQSDKSPKTISLKQLNALLQQQDDKLYVINFWATWCKPCIDEMPDFLAVNELYKDDPNFKMIFISLDHIKLLHTKVKTFVEKHKINAEVYLLDEKRNAYEWMPEFEASWNGAIPSTGFYKNGEKLLFKQFQMNRYELEDYIDDFIQ